MALHHCAGPGTIGEPLPTWSGRGFSLESGHSSTKKREIFNNHFFIALWCNLLSQLPTINVPMSPPNINIVGLKIRINNKINDIEKIDSIAI